MIILKLYFFKDNIPICVPRIGKYDNIGEVSI